MTHSYGYDLADQLWLGCRRLTLTFTGVSAHAFSQPHMARNALDAAALAYQGMGMLRQHMDPVEQAHVIMAVFSRSAHQELAAEKHAQRMDQAPAGTSATNEEITRLARRVLPGLLAAMVQTA